MRELPAVTAGEAALLLRLAPPTVRRLLARGELRGIKTSSGGRAHWRVSSSELERFLAEGPRR